MHSVKPCIDERLIGELSRFFGGWDATLKEIFQNCHRAGATEVTVTANPSGSIITFHDDGRGCQDPGFLFAAGATGWDTTQVTEPAGLGFYSLFNPDLVERLEVESHAWKLAFKTQAMLTVPPPEIPVVTRMFAPGFTLKLWTKEQHNDLETEIESARGYYPFNVTLNGKVIEAAQPESDFSVVTTVGAVYWKKNLQYSHSVTGVWEYKSINSAAVEKALKKAAWKHPFKRIAEGLLGSYTDIVWFVNPDCGVRPRLPDRSEFIEGVHLDSAAEILINTLVDKVLELVMPITDNLPDRFEGDKNLAKWSRNLDDDILLDLGWHRVRSDDLDDLSVSEEDDSASLDFNSGFTVWDKNAISAHEDVVLTIAQLYALSGGPTAMPADAGSKEVPVEFVNLRTGGEYIALADEIKWNGLYLPYLFVHGEIETDDESANVFLVIAAKKPQDAIAVLQYEDEERLVNWAIYRAHEDYDAMDRDWIVEEYGEYELDHQKCLQDLCLDVVDSYGPKSLRNKILSVQKLDTAIEDLRKAQVNMSRLGKDRKAVGVKALDARLQKLYKDSLTLERDLGIERGKRNKSLGKLAF